MELLAPKPLCAVINCEDLESLDLAAALAELKRGHEVIKLLPGIYAQRHDFRRLSPSLIGDFEYCPRLLWVERRLGLKLFGEGALAAMVKGRLLHERYERAVSQYDNVITEYKIEIDGLVGVVDVLIKRGRALIPVEVKTGAGRRAHRLQLQIYIAMLKADFGYLVYRDRVEVVEGSSNALKVLEEVREVLRSEAPPPPPLQEKCGRCRFKPICHSAAPLQPVQV